MDKKGGNDNGKENHHTHHFRISNANCSYNLVWQHVCCLIDNCLRAIRLVAIAQNRLRCSCGFGRLFEYIFSYRCASITENCENAIITDVLPPEIEFISLAPSPNVDFGASSFPPPGSTVVIVFDLIDGPDKGLTAGDTGILTMKVRFPPGTVPGTVATNKYATISADNATSVTSPEVDVTTTGQFEMFARKRLVGEAVAGFPTTFAVEICSPDVIGGVRFIDPVIVDTLPDDAQFLDAEGVENVDWEYDPGPPQTLSFINLPDVEVGGCLTRTFTVLYDTIPATLPQINQMEATGTPENSTTTVTLDAEREFPVIAPYAEGISTKSSTSPSSYIGTEARPGETVTYQVGVENTGYLDFSGVSVFDEIPGEVELISWEVVPTTETAATVDGYYQINNSGSWVALSGESLQHLHYHFGLEPGIGSHRCGHRPALGHRRSAG